MALSEERINYLFQQYAANTCSKEELQELYEQVNQIDDSGFYKLLDEHYEKLKAGPAAERVDWAHMFQQVVKEQSAASVSNRVHFNRRRWWAVAASIILALGLGGYFSFFNKGGKRNEIVKTKDPVSPDVKAPETNLAMITLSDGKKVYLDSMGNRQLALQGNVKVLRNADGHIVYEGTAEAMEYNTLFNPRGSKVQPLTLSDGTKVWLNSESSIRFPTAFSGNERRVAVTGEAYFEVAHDATKPFYVSKGDLVVQVVGTHFNVNAYDDEGNIKVTLLEGSVKTAISNGQSVVLKPGQQAQVSSSINVINDADLDEVMAWKNGKFIFGAKADIQTILRQIARWYDVEVGYAGGVPKQRFGGEMPRTTNLSQVLEILKTSGVRFSIEGRRVTIRP